MVFLIGQGAMSLSLLLETMSKVLPLSKNYKDYEDVPDGLKWAIPIHECLEKPEVKERSRRLEEESKKRVKKEFKLNF
jgi:hypothetical protein